MDEKIIKSFISMPDDFIQFAKKNGWSTLNFHFAANSVFLLKGRWRIKFARFNEKKYWFLDTLSSNDWVESHVLIHPGNSRLNWVLVTFEKLISHYDGSFIPGDDAKTDEIIQDSIATQNLENEASKKAPAKKAPAKRK